jgi:hypothetical protein
MAGQPAFGAEGSLRSLDPHLPLRLGEIQFRFRKTNQPESHADFSFCPTPAALHKGTRGQESRGAKGLGGKGARKPPPALTHVRTT